MKIKNLICNICVILSDCWYLFGLSAGAAEYANNFADELGACNECAGYDTKPSDSEAPVSLHCHYSKVHSDRVVVPVKIPSIDQLKLFNHLLYLKPFKVK